MNIIQVYQTNPFEEGQGGGVRYLKNLIFGINEKCEGILFFGIGEHHQKQNNIKLIPVTRKLTGYITFLVLLMIKLPFLNLTKYDVVHVHRLYFAIPFIIFKPKLKIVCSLHGRTFSVFESNHGSKMMNVVKFFFKIIERYCIRKIDYLVPVSQDVVNSFKEKYLDFDSYNQSIVGSMFDTSKFEIIQSNYLQDKIGNNKKYVLFLGRLSNVKDVEFLIKLWSKKFQKNNEIKLVIAGTGEEDDRLKLLVNKICFTNKPLFIGEIRPTNIPKIISSANMCILSSFHEASPTVIKESLSSGIPIITNNIGDVENFIVNNKNGFIVEKNIESYYNSILSLIENPIQKEDVLKYSENQLKKSSNSFVSDQFIKIYKTLI